MRILVVEDEKDTADSFKTLLSLFGHAVEGARDGADALLAAHANPPDVVFLDIAMPGMDGWEVARRLRRVAFVRRPAIVAVSGYGQAADKKHSREAGVDFHFVKPIDPALLQEFLRGLPLVTPLLNTMPS
jgi:two-component system OmpR family response regulator